MNDKEFDKILQLRISKIENTLSAKAQEYAGDNDRLHNFNRAAETLRCTPAKALIGFWMKHIVSLLDIVDDLDHGKLASEEMIDEKIGDAINYLVLLEAVLTEAKRE